MPDTADKPNVSVDASTFPRSIQWSSRAVLHNLTSADIRLSKEEIVELRPMRTVRLG